MNDLHNSTFSVEAEQSVLGALLSDPEAMERCAFLEPAHFYRGDHRAIYQEIQRQFHANKTPDALTVAERLGDKVDNAMQYLIQLRMSEPSGARVRTHADIVVEKAKRRALMALACEIQEAVSGAAEVRDIADSFVGRIEAVAHTRTMREPMRMSAMMNDYVLTLQKRQSGEIRPVATGFEDLDAILGGGLESGTLNILAGRPSMGKTALGLNMAGNVGEAGDVAEFLSMEMPRDQVLDRRISAMAHIPLAWLRRPDLDSTQWNSLTRAIELSQGQDLFIDDQTALNMTAIRAKARKVKRATGRLGLLVIDQLSFIAGSKLERRNEQVSEYTRALVALAKELDCPILLLCQLNRSLELRPNKRPMMSDLAESGSIEQDAAVIMFAYRDEVYNADSPDIGTAEIIVAKARQGKTGTARLAYIGEQTRFANLHKGWIRPPRAEPTRSQRGGLD